MQIKKHIPNLLTLGNLFCGVLATIMAVEESYEAVVFFVFIGIFFDFLDGFVARLLGVSGELGKQLDSLADMVTSGVVPGLVMFNLIWSNDPIFLKRANHGDFGKEYFFIAVIGIILSLGACYRLAKFNIDTRQSESFIGLPTPAMCLFVVSLPLINTEFVRYLLSNNIVLIAISLLLTYLMNAEISLFSLKFKNFSFKNNWIKYVLLLSSLVLLITLHFLAIPLIIILYVLLSLIQNYGKKATI